MCQRFLENACITSGRFPSAMAAFTSLRSAGAIQTSRAGVPAGALAVLTGPADKGAGHVMVGRGDGTFISEGASGPSVRVFTTPNPASTFLG